MNRFALVVLAWLASTDSIVRGGVDDATRATLLKEYSEAAARIERVYERIKFDCKETKADGTEELWTYARDDASTRWVMTDVRSGRSHAVVADPKLSFRVHRDAATEDYHLTTRADATMPAAMQSDIVSTEVRSLPAFAPYRAYLECPIVPFLTDPNCTITAVTRGGQAPNRVVRVDWERVSAKPGGKPRFGTFEFLPDAGWVLKSYSIYTQGRVKDPQTGQDVDTAVGGELDYRGEHEGVSLVHRVTTWTSGRQRAEGPS